MTLTVFKAGNTWAVSVPRELAIKLNLKLGDKVEPYLVDHSFAYRPTKTGQGEISSEFNQWLQKTAKKYGSALKKLASE